MFNHDTSTLSAATALLDAAPGRVTSPQPVRAEDWDGL